MRVSLALGVQRAEQVAERHFVLEAREQRVAHPAEHRDERRVAREVDAHRDRVHEEAVHVFERPVAPAVGEPREHDVVLPGVAVQQARRTPP